MARLGYFIAFLSFNICNFVLSFDLPFDRCNPSDTKCLIANVEKMLAKMTSGFPELKMGPIEPLQIENLQIGGGQGAVKVDQNYRNAKVHGFSTAVIEDVKVNLDNKTIFMKMKIENSTMEADYNLNGQILLLPIRGDGHSTISLINLNITHILQAEEVVRSGKPYWKILEYNITMQPERVYFNFENLFGGDKMLGDVMNRVVNENWMDVFDDVKEGYEKAFGQIYRHFANRFFKMIPLSRIFLTTV